MKIKAFFVSTLGTAGYILYFAIVVIYNFLPAYVLDFPLWAFFLISFAITSIPYANILYGGVWVWALVVATTNPITPLSILFFIAFGLKLFNVIITFISSFH